MEHIRRRYTVSGIVQGVGFRPHVARTAASFPVTGFVGNNDVEVFIEVQGEASVVDAFFSRMVATAPAISRINDYAYVTLPLVDGEEAFRIVESDHVAGTPTLIPPDTAMCEHCRAEFHDPSNRRYHHPFITCTECGPRLTIITDVPYDRPATTMADFPMCAACHAEYTTATDRRFHAQPISCPDCGPRMWIEYPDGTRVDASPDELAEHVHRLWDAGKIVAVKGIGGFHLMAPAQGPGAATALEALRQRKRRPAKPFAVMWRNPEELVELSAETRELIYGPAAPIVIAPSRGLVHGLVAPHLNEVGVMVPYSPLHELLVDRPVVATSGNPSGQPVCTDNAQARTQLAGFADAFVMHDRPIYRAAEDSVTRGRRIIRRGRGMAPIPIDIPSARDAEAGRSNTAFVAVGAELKNAPALLVGQRAHLFPHIGDQESWQGRVALNHAIADLLRMHRVDAHAVVADLHPGYSTVAWAEDYAEKHDIPLIQVQHHHAHARGLLAEHGITTGAVVAVLDGTGYGTDGTIWGCEILYCSPGAQWVREDHMPAFTLAGGNQAVRHPWRLARALVGDRADFSPVDPTALKVVDSQLRTGTGTVQCSSLGRLFDAAAYLIGAFRGEVTYEGQAAMELEALAATAPVPAERYAPSWSGLVTDCLDNSVAPAVRARRFHQGVAALVGDGLVAAARRHQTTVVGVSGGCALNQLLMADLQDYLAAAGLNLLEHQTVPANDGGLALGQAAAAALGVDDSALLGRF